MACNDSCGMLGGWMERKPEPELMDLVEEAEAYAAADFADVNDAFVQRLTEVAGAARGARVLDLGCGPGDIAVRIARRRPDWRVVAVDASAAMLDLAVGLMRRLLPTSRVRFLRCDAKHTPLASGAFDVIACNSLLHHMPEPVALWREIGRLVRPGGAILLRDLHRPHSDAAARRIVEQHAEGASALLCEEFHRSLLAAFTVAEIEQQLNQSGLAGLSVQRTSDRHVDAWRASEIS